MSDVPALTVPPAGWYPDRSEANLVRWWDGQQWTDQTQSTAPAAAAFERPVSAAAFGFEAAPAQAPAQAQPQIVAAAQFGGGVAVPADAWMQPGVNSLATRGMIYSLIGLVINPFAMMSIGGLVLGIRALRRAAQFVPSAARRGQAIAAVVLGGLGIIWAVVVVVVAIAVAQQVAHRTSAHVFDHAGAERQILSQLQSGQPAIPVVSVACPPDPAMNAGDAFDCVATLNDGRSLPVHILIHVDNGVYTYSWSANLAEVSGSSPANPDPAPSDGSSGPAPDIANT